MNVNDKLYGFTVKEKRYVKELTADVYTLIYDTCGTRLTYIAREDDNKTFSIAFKTLPEDSTGVFHILEHSVLCGSEKYPVKDPFVELLKGSLNTFLNAMTFQDKTMYPVSSRNDKDFYNLVGIYMDAVLHPLAVKSPNAFYQEGWHYEMDENGKLSYKGVVLNEMKGDYSSPESVCDRHIDEMLYEGTPYAYDSGGDPEEITALTYEQFVAAHEKYYHPTYAEMLLDGSVNLSEILPLLSSYLSEYERSEVPASEFDIPRVTISEPKSRTVYYEVKDGESTENKTRLAEGFIVGDFSQYERLVGVNILQRALFSTNESQIKRAVVNSGLCEDMTASMRDGILEPAIIFEFINVKDGKEEELRTLFFDEVRRAVECGIDKDELESNLSFTEFQVRERDFGTLPVGVANAMISLESLLYSDNPVQNFRCDECFASLRKRVADGYFEELLRSIVLDNKKRASLVMLPSTEIAHEREDRERARLDGYERGLTAEGRAELDRMNAELISWQESEDTDEALATIPTLSLSDIDKEPRSTPTDSTVVDGVEVITHNIPTNSIVYTELLFDISDIEKEELPILALYNFLVMNLGTECRTASEVQRLIKAELGGFDVRMTPMTRIDGAAPQPKIYLTVSACALDAKRESIPKIAEELLCKTVFTDAAAIKNILRQTVIASEESFATTGHQVAMGRVTASCGVEGAVREYYNGYESYLVFKEMDKHFDERCEEISKRLSALTKRFITRERLTVSVTGECDTKFIESLVKIAPRGEKVAPVCKIQPIPVRREGIAIPAQVAFAARGYNLFSIGERPNGSFDVVRTLVGYEFLWGEIRVKGGAYGAGMSAGISGALGFYSYRDPTPARTLEKFSEVPAFLRGFAAGEPDITKYIIGAVGDAEPVRTPRMRGSAATARYLRGITREDECALRRSMLSVDKAELLRIADILEECLKDGASCTVASREKLSAIESLDEILEI